MAAAKPSARRSETLNERDFGSAFLPAAETELAASKPLNASYKRKGCRKTGQ